LPNRLHSLGLLFSTTGSYGAMARASLDGAMLAINQINSDKEIEIGLDPAMADPGGDLRQYGILANALLERGIRHVIGCYTSLSRKEVIPIFEKRDALLWYPAHYEGFETSSNVIYTGAAPNQHITPLITWALAHVGRQAFCIGSNYVWAWETNRVLREGLISSGGSVVRERYVAIDDFDFEHVVADILSARPHFIFCTLIGVSAACFFGALREACLDAGIDQARDLPVLTCNLNETTMRAVAPFARDGHISSAVYFSAVATPENRAFVSAFRDRFGVLPSADAEAAFCSVHLLAHSLNETSDGAPAAIRSALARQRLLAPQGEVSIDVDTMHAYLTPRIGRSLADGSFDIIEESPAPLAPDPYLVRSAPRLAPRMLRLVS
jgi:ABC-type branched-subunit amino acid transport system substrate-binding protein